jgi:phosphoribosylformylglycinamidine synthase
MPIRAESAVETSPEAANATAVPAAGAAPSNPIPTPTLITPALLKTHSITSDEYARIETLMGRTPSLTELGIFSVMWSEHCSYKSSRVHLKRLPTKGTRTSGPGSVVQGPGENAGIIDVGDGWACAFKIESHNHPSYIEPYQGAATGVGGILRDIFTMNARPFAVMDSLRFGPLIPDQNSDTRSAARGTSDPSPLITPRTTDHTPLTTTDFARNRQTMAGVVGGIAGYGNCFGVPNLGGETRFEACYSGNPLVNAFALGLVRTDEIFYAKATGVGNPVIYVGAKTGRDGIHGATMASEEFTEGSEQKRPNVQMGDPFMEKLLLEACLEAMATGAVLGIQDMGAAGLTCSTCEMGARGELGLTIELDCVPQRAEGMTAYEIMLSESQERMLLVADKGREGEVLAIFAKWGLDASIVGAVTADDVMRVTHHGELVAEIPNKALTDDAPVYNRPVGVWKAPVPLDPPAWVLEELKKARDYTSYLKRLLGSANICDKRWVFEQYDSMVQTNTVQGPGGEAGVMRIKGTGSASAGHGILSTVERLVAESTPQGEVTLATGNVDATNPVVEPDASHAPGVAAKPERGIAMALAGNGRWCWLDPKLGAMHAVAEAARKVACTGAVPVAATNCLNFGNPEKPEIMAQLSAAIDGIAEACTGLGTPVTGGNVSLYNETKGEGIYPTPVIGVVGLLEDVSNAVSAGLRDGDEMVLILGAPSSKDETTLRRELGSSEFAKFILNETWGTPPALDIDREAQLHRFVRRISASGLIRSAQDVSSGGIAVALAKLCISKNMGINADLSGWKWASQGAWEVADVPSDGLVTECSFFGEHASMVLVTGTTRNIGEVIQLSQAAGVSSYVSGTISTELDGLTLSNQNPWSKEHSDAWIEVSAADLSSAYSGQLEAQLAAEVVTA